MHVDLLPVEGLKIYKPYAYYIYSIYVCMHICMHPCIGEKLVGNFASMIGRRQLLYSTTNYKVVNRNDVVLL